MTSRRGLVSGTLAALGIVLLFGLGLWQIERRIWKLNLIERVDARVTAPPQAVPGVERWASISAMADEYRHVRLNGEYLPHGQSLVTALTRLGGGYWVLTPLRTDEGSIVFINRGFIPAQLRTQESAYAPRAGEVTVEGLLRISEPRGTLLRQNVPAEHRWYSRDIAAMAQAAALGDAVAPYFVDAGAGVDASASASAGTPGYAARLEGIRYPVAGLTVIQFPNNHLLYAITWFSLGALGLGVLVAGRRHEGGRSEDASPAIN
ncbi:MAG TPA: SURF1 family protein [Steroidobacteraceae bacterium]|nr:SURF1 family protein [Steroidobacteraceae bacterium]